MSMLMVKVEVEGDVITVSSLEGQALADLEAHIESLGDQRVKLVSNAVANSYLLTLARVVQREMMQSVMNDLKKGIAEAVKGEQN